MLKSHIYTAFRSSVNDAAATQRAHAQTGKKPSRIRAHKLLTVCIPRCIAVWIWIKLSQIYGGHSLNLECPDGRSVSREFGEEPSAHMRSEGCHSVCLFVTTFSATTRNKAAIPTGSVPHWLDLKNGDFRKSTAFKSYGVKTKRTSQYANKHGLP